METGSGAGGGLMFVKEEVKPLSNRQTTSLLSSSLAKKSSSVDTRQALPMSPIRLLPQDRRQKYRRSRSDTPGEETKVGTPVRSPSGGLTPPLSVTRSHPVTGSVGSRGSYRRRSSLAEDIGGFSVQHVIATVLPIALAAHPSASTLPTGAEDYHLRIAEDGTTTVDDDFPELDGTVEIMTVGVTTFLLAEAKSELVIAALVLPKDVVGLRRQQRDAMRSVDAQLRRLDGSEPVPVVIPSSLPH